MNTCRRGHPLESVADYDKELLKLGKKRCGRCAAVYRREWKERKRREAGSYKRGEKPYCRHGHALTASNRKAGSGECLTCHREREERKRRAAGVRPQMAAIRCARGHDLTVEGNRRANRVDCAICHRLRSLKDEDAISYGEMLLRDPCSYCGAPTEQIDHIQPFSRGGPNGWENLTGACRSCNARKRTRSALTYLLERAA